MLELNIPRGEPMPEIDSIITAKTSVSAYGFAGLHEAVKYLSDYSLQLEMVRQVGHHQTDHTPHHLYLLIRFFLKKMFMLLTEKI